MTWQAMHLELQWVRIVLRTDVRVARVDLTSVAKLVPEQHKVSNLYVHVYYLLLTQVVMWSSG